MHAQEVCYPPPPIIPQLWHIRTLQGIFCFLPTYLIQMVDPPGSLECWGWVSLLVSQAAGVESQHVPGVLSIKAPGNVSQASPCSQGTAY